MIWRKRFNHVFFDFFDMISFLVFVGWIVLFIRFFIMNPYTVVGASMYPTFDESDFIVVDKITPRFWQLQRGDVIVFVPPGKTIPYIKRIIWLPWETVKIKKNAVVVCSQDGNCTTLDESVYLSSDVKTESRCWVSEFVVQTWYFVMWDNRWFSTDSRCCFGLECYSGATYEVPFNNIVGKVYIRFYPQFTAF